MLLEETLLYHGTSAQDFERFERDLNYLAPSIEEARQFAENPIVGGGRGKGNPRVLEVTARPGNLKDINDVVEEALFADEDIDSVIGQEAAKADGYRYISFMYPGVGQDNFQAIVSLYPTEDLCIVGIVR